MASTLARFESTGLLPVGIPKTYVYSFSYNTQINGPRQKMMWTMFLVLVRGLHGHHLSELFSYILHIFTKSRQSNDIYFSLRTTHKPTLILKL
jgi:hypothetical protein